MKSNIEIEVAFCKSTFPDVTGTNDGGGKGRTPKEEMTCTSNLGHTVNSRMTVICVECLEGTPHGNRVENCPVGYRWCAIETITSCIFAGA